MPLSDAAQRLVGEPCAPGSCSEAQLAAGVCPPDPHLTCQLPERLPSAGGPPPVYDVKRRETYVANARPGWLFLCPGDGMGVIGGLLAQLRHPQHFTHMGVFLDDGTTIRHCTVTQDQMTADKHAEGSLLGEPVPTDGFQDAAMRYGWPGTVTQRVDDAFHKWPDALKLMDADDDTYDVAELSFTAVQTPDGELLRPLVVKPRTPTTAVADVLRVIAHAVAELHGHYRFYAYSDAQIGTDPGQVGPALSVRKQQPNGQWVEQNTRSTDPGDLCNTDREPVTESMGLVCSTLPWAAVQLINDGVFVGRTARDWGRNYRIKLDIDPFAPAQTVVDGDPGAYVTGPGADGLYSFDESDRANAAEWFHEALKDKVAKEAAEKVPDILRLAGYGGIGAGLVLGALGPVGAALLIGAGLTAALADDVLEAVTNMQDHVANQMVNLFANDGAQDPTTSEAWRDPGTGLSVGPDDIAWFWRGPGDFDGDELYGPYGANEWAALRRRQWVQEVQCVWRESPSRQGVLGRVTRDDGSGPVGVEGAVVEFACESFVAGPDGVVETDAPEGIYLLNASWTDPATGYVWESRRNEHDVEVPGRFDVELVPPPQEFRRVDLYGSIDLVQKVLVGHDVWAHARPSQTGFLGPYSALHPDPAQRDEGLTWNTSVGAEADDARCDVQLLLRWNEDLSIHVTLTSQITDEGEVDATHTDAVTIAEDDSHTFSFTLDSGDEVPNRATVSLTLVNARQS